MKLLPMIVCALLALSGCAHKELMAPCGPIAFAGQGDPCGELVPINIVQADAAEEKKS